MVWQSWQCNKAGRVVCCCGAPIDDDNWYQALDKSKWYGLCKPCASHAWRDATKLEGGVDDTPLQGSKFCSADWQRFIEEIGRKFGEKPSFVQDEQGDDDDMDL